MKRQNEKARCWDGLASSYKAKICSGWLKSDPWLFDVWLGQGHPVETISTGISFQVLDSLRLPSAYRFTTSLDGSALVLGEDLFWDQAM